MAIRRVRVGPKPREENVEPAATRPWGGYLPPPPPPGENAEHWKLQRDRFVAQSDFEKAMAEREKLDLQWSVESIKLTTEFSKLAINAGLLINGGAAVAIIAHIASGPAREAGARVAFSALALPLLLFAFGVASATACAAASYLSQSQYTDRRNKTAERRGDFWRELAAGSMIACLACFVGGACLTAHIVSR